MARLLAPDAMRDAETAFYAESATELSERAAKAATELRPRSRLDDDPSGLRPHAR